MDRSIRRVTFFDGIQYVTRKMIKAKTMTEKYMVVDKYNDGCEYAVLYRGKADMTLAQADYLLDIVEQ